MPHYSLVKGTLSVLHRELVILTVSVESTHLSSTLLSGNLFISQNWAEGFGSRLLDYRKSQPPNPISLFFPCSPILLIQNNSVITSFLNLWFSQALCTSCLPALAWAVGGACSPVLSVFAQRCTCLLFSQTCFFPFQFRCCFVIYFCTKPLYFQTHYISKLDNFPHFLLSFLTPYFIS